MKNQTAQKGKIAIAYRGFKIHSVHDDETQIKRGYAIIKDGVKIAEKYTVTRARETIDILLEK